jgi:hypothetical protein
VPLPIVGTGTTLFFKDDKIKIFCSTYYYLLPLFKVTEKMRTLVSKLEKFKSAAEAK